jgi:hypothetical protein
VKFAAVAAIVLSLTTSVAVTRLHRRSLGAAPWARRAGVLAATVLTVGSTAAGLAFHLAVWLGPDLRASMQHRLPALSAADWRVLEYLRLHVGPEELVLREQAVSLRYDILGGLHIPWMPDDDGAFVDPRAPPPYVSVHGGQVDIAFVSPAYRDQRRRLLAARPDAISAWIAEGITWFVVEPRDPLRAIVERWVAAGEATIAFEAAPLVVVRARVAPPDRPAPGSAP